MKTIDIKEKLTEIGVSLNDIILGDFDSIGEFTAKRQRSQSELQYKTKGAFYRSNYERGILIYYLIKQFELRSVLEIGFGRGYSTFCAAKAFVDLGIDGTVTSIDPNFDEKFLSATTQIFPSEWFKHIKLIKGESKDVIPKLEEKQFDLVYIDGDHSYEGTKSDWDLTKTLAQKFVLFDDYHLPTKTDPGIQCNKLIDEIDDPTKELILMDRRIFLDDRQIEKIDYGQVLLTLNNSVVESRHVW